LGDLSGISLEKPMLAVLNFGSLIALLLVFILPFVPVSMSKPPLEAFKNVSLRAVQSMVFLIVALMMLLWAFKLRSLSADFAEIGIFHDLMTYFMPFSALVIVVMSINTTRLTKTWKILQKVEENPAALTPKSKRYRFSRLFILIYQINFVTR